MNLVLLITILHGSVTLYSWLHSSLLQAFFFLLIFCNAQSAKISSFNQPLLGLDNILCVDLDHIIVSLK